MQNALLERLRRILDQLPLEHLLEYLAWRLRADAQLEVRERRRNDA